LAIAVPAGHPLAARKRVSFAQTLDYEHAGMPTASAVQVLLHRAAAQAGKPLIHRVIVANFDSALRVVQAGLAITIVPVEVASPYARGAGLRIVPLEDAWARRRFMLCFRDADSLTPAARLLLDHLSGAADAAPAPAGLYRRQAAGADGAARCRERPWLIWCNSVRKACIVRPGSSTSTPGGRSPSRC